MLENVSQPLYKDPLLILSHLQNSAASPDTSVKSEENKKVEDPDE